MAVSLILAACGGGGSDVRPMPQSVSKIVFATTSAAHSAPLQAISMKVKLPNGVTFRSISSVSGKNNTGITVPEGYSAIDNTVSFSVLATGTKIDFGPFTSMKCTVISGGALDKTGVTTLNTPFPTLKMTGFSIDGSTQDLSKEIPVTIAFE